jgi:hypothetical protein
MASEGNGNGQAAAPVAAPSVSITFPGPGLADPTINLENVTPGQLMAAAFLLDCIAREVRQGQVTRQAMGGLATNPSDLLDGLRKLGRI